MKYKWKEGEGLQPYSNESKEDHENRQAVYELTGIRDESMHVKPYADMIEKMSYIQKADFAKAALDNERELKACKNILFEESLNVFEKVQALQKIFIK